MPGVVLKNEGMIQMSGTDPKATDSGFAAFEHTAQRVEEGAESKAEALSVEKPGNASPGTGTGGAADQISGAGQAAADRVESVASRAAGGLEAAGKAGAGTVEAVVSGAAERVRTTGEAIAGKARDVTKKASGYADQLSSTRASATDAVNQAPIAALLVAGAVGWVLGMLANARR